MARTKPSSKAKQRADSLQKEMAIEVDDSEMRSTLQGERGRRVGFKKVGEATSSATYPSKDSVAKRTKKRGSANGLDEIRAKISERKSQADGARRLKKRGY